MKQSRRASARFLVVLFWSCVASYVAAQQRSPQQQRPPAEYAKTLEEPDRVARLQVPRVVQALGLRSGMSVADVGAGSGLFARPMATAVAPGLVYAVDVDAELLKILASRAKAAGVTTVETIVGRPEDPLLPKPVDVVFICDALHHIANPAAYLKTIRRYVAPGGRLAIIDYNRNWPEGHETMQFTPSQLAEWIAAAGFTRVASHDWIENSFFEIYR